MRAIDAKVKRIDAENQLAQPRSRVTSYPIFLACFGILSAAGLAVIITAGSQASFALLGSALVLLSWVGAGLSFVPLVARPLARLSSFAAKRIAPGITGLGSAISTFASGNMVAKAVPSQASAASNLDIFAACYVIEDALKAGMEDFNSITARPSNRICFSGCNSYEEGRVAGRQIKKLLEGKGRIICLLPSHSQVNHALRLKGCLNYLAESRSDISAVKILETGGAIDPAEALAKDLFSKKPDFDLLYITDGFTPQAFCKVMRESLGRGERRPKIVTYDVVEENVELLRSGEISCLIEQNMFAQTYNSLVLLYNHLESGWQPVSKKLFHSPMVVDAANVGEYWDPARRLRTITSEEKRLLAEPVRQRSAKRYRLGLVLPTTGGFAQGLENGAKAAKETLSGNGVEVQIVNAFRDWTDFGMASAFRPVIDGLVAAGIDGIATCAFDEDIVGIINELVDKGIAVTTYNAEPSNFRELVENIIGNIGNLAKNSQSLAASAEESSRANRQIMKSVAGIGDGITQQKEGIARSDSELDELNGKLSGINAAISAYGALVERITAQTRNGSVKLQESASTSKELMGAISGIHESIRDFVKMLGSINEIVARIMGFSEETNVLAINATIQAARAGVAGKGFSVVAAEVRKLAENSARAADDIKGIVQVLGRGLDKLVESSSKSVDLVDGNFSKSAQAKDAFEAIAELIATSGGEISTIAAAMRGIGTAGATLKANMDAIETMSGVNASRIAEIGQSVDQLAEQGADLSATANELRSMAESQGLLFSQLTIQEDDR